MAESRNLETLTSSLSLDERQALLQKLKTSLIISSDSLYNEDVEGSVIDVAEEFSQLPLFLRIWFVIQGIFKAKSAASVYEDRRIAEEGRRIERNAPNIFDYKKMRLLPACYDLIERLKEAARFFYSALDASFNQDKGAFFAFLASLEMADIHIKIQSTANVDDLEAMYPNASVTELRKRAVHRMEHALEDINDEMKKTMYFNSRSLFCLKELSSFPFDRVSKFFSYDPVFRGQCCSVSLIKDMLISLNNILFSLRQIPHLSLFESLFVFMLQKKQQEDIVSGFEDLMSKAGESLEIIRNFNSKVPLASILKFCTKDIKLSPVEISGGEDWLSVYCDYWKRKIEKNFNVCIENRKEQKLLNIFSTFLKGAIFQHLPGTASSGEPDGIPMRGTDAVVFISAFYSMIFVPEMSETLNTILIEGEFRLKEENVKFTESYNSFFTLEDSIDRLVRDISVRGDIGRRYLKAKQEMNVQPMVKRRRCESIANEASGEAYAITGAVYNASKYMAEFLGKLANREVSNDIITNLPRLATKDSLLMKNIADMSQKFQQAVQIMDDFNAADARR